MPTDPKAYRAPLWLRGGHALLKRLGEMDWLPQRLLAFFGEDAHRLR